MTDNAPNPAQRGAAPVLETKAAVRSLLHSPWLSVHAAEAPAWALPKS